MRVLDACAAPGAKATAIAERLCGGSAVTSLDPRRSALARLGIEALRLGLSGIDAVVGDARLPPLRASFDAVLVDAPCTGLGTLRRHPELRWRLGPEDVPRLAALQRAILHQVAPLVRPGGILVYAVCTLTREETDGVVADFLSTHPWFDVEPGQQVVPERARALFDSSGCLRTLPSSHGVDGFFAARLRAA
jgi:16S rRNA (cytosine967-C5)-methyltransferase